LVFGHCGLCSADRVGSGLPRSSTRHRVANNVHICQRWLIRWCRDRCLASMSRVCLCGRTAAGHAAIPLGPGRRPVSSLAGLSPLFCSAPTDRVGLLSLWTNDSAKPAILRLVRKSPARVGFGQRAIGTAVFGARFDDHSLNGETKGGTYHQIILPGLCPG
jgi:hypothetical protein